MTHRKEKLTNFFSKKNIRLILPAFALSLMFSCSAGSSDSQPISAPNQTQTAANLDLGSVTKNNAVPNEAKAKDSSDAPKVIENTEPEVKQKLELRPLIDVLKSQTFAKTLWSLGVRYNDEGTPLVRNEDAAKDIRNGVFDNFGPFAGEKSLLKEHKEAAASYFDRLGIIGGSRPIFLYSKDSSSTAPVRFAEFKDEQVVLVNAALTKVLNTFPQPQAKQRAKSVITEYIVTEIDDMYEGFESKKDIKYFGISLVYGTEDFTSDSVTDKNEEFVALVSHRDNLKSFKSGEITDTEFLSDSFIFLSDENSFSDVIRIELE